MDDKILNIFRASNGEFISGEEISEKLKVSRAAVWKHIERLREEGYDIAGEPHVGYRLMGTPDKLIPEEISYRLGTKTIGKRIHSYESTGSTNDIAQKLAESGSPEGTAVFSEGQSKGRGRLGREWSSPKGKGIYLSLILRPKISPTHASKITLMSAIAVAAAIRKITDLTALIKWPNDIMVNGHKVCGILTEMSAEVNTVKYVVIGIGINVNTDRERLPKGASSLKSELGETVSRVELTQELLREIEHQYRLFREEGFEQIITGWRNLSYMLGERVSVKCQDKKIEGYAVDLDLNGALVIRLDSGFTENVTAGDVIMVR
jgi:BirA family transcriptional regulator, biotin operon repressor / biotin---[acetyl-CoA-carboxylase] ligase